MKTVNLSEQNSVLNQYMAEIRDVDYQRNRLLFRNNIERIGEYMACEISKALTYRQKDIQTPLGVAKVSLPEDEIVIATVLRAGLPFHQGFLNVFDHAGNAFVSAYRMYTNREHTEEGVRAAGYEALLKNGKPASLHIACVIATEEGLGVVEQAVPEDTTVWCASIDPGMNEHKYIVPGFGDAGDLCYGDKL